MQRTCVHSLVWKILHAVEQLSPRVAVTEPMAYVPQLLKPERLESCALRQEKGLQRESHTRLEKTHV